MIVEIPVKVSFLKHTLLKRDPGVVIGDYNSTKLVFDFEEDVSKQRIVFKMSNTHGELILMKDLKDNEVVLAGYKDDGTVYSLFDVVGLYPFELVAYGENSKITSAPGWISVNKRQVDLGNSETVEGYLPAIDAVLSGIGRGIVYISIKEVTSDV